MKLEIPQDALYFSIRIGLGRGGFNIAPRDMEPVWTEGGGYHDTSYYDIHAQTTEAPMFEMDLDRALQEGEESYPDDTWVELSFYDPTFKLIRRYEASVENNYYNCDLEADMRVVVKNFIKTRSET